HPRIPLPADLFRPERRNSRGLDLSDPLRLAEVARAMAAAVAQPWRAAPIIGGVEQPGAERAVFAPPDRRRRHRALIDAADAAAVGRAAARAAPAAESGARGGSAQRAEALERAADLYERHLPELMALIVREGGRILPDALSEVREAVDFLRYYAQRARAQF